jgi:two-component system, cell cycle sensor histidine kinase and response regulator CckA
MNSPFALEFASDMSRSESEPASTSSPVVPIWAPRVPLDMLVTATLDLLTVVDECGVVRFQGASSFLGRSAGTLVGTRIDAMMDHEDAGRFRRLLSLLLQEQVDPRSVEFTLRHTDSSLRTLELFASRMSLGGGATYVVLQWRDVGERRRTEEILKQRDEMLRRAQRMESVGRLAGGIAHDFNNVLMVITAACERLCDQVADASARRQIDRILRHSARAASLVRQLLAFSRQQQLSPRSTDLGQLIRQTSELIREFIGDHVQLNIDISPDLSPVKVDPGQIEQVLMNLAINARDALSEGGQLKVSARNVVIDEAFARDHPPQPAGAYALVRVSDTGHGMAPNVRERAFEPFFTTKATSRGSGLGLSTVYGIVKQSGGYIWLESEPGCGTTFDIFLPPTTESPTNDEALVVRLPVPPTQNCVNGGG